MSLNYLATRFTCSWPWSIGVLLCDGRMVCGCADPVRQAGAGRHAHLVGRRHLAGPGRHASSAPTSTPAARRFCGDCPLKLPLEPDQAPPQRDLAVQRRSRAASTSSARRPVTSRASRRAARPKPASPARARPACSTSICSRGSSTKPGPRSAASTSSTTARRSCTSAPSRCASTSRRSSRTSISTPAPTAWRSPRRRCASSRARASTK